ncbi:4Fe-4S dicluster domain-containing protein [Bacteroidales bacterium OttesenSCG-928-I21]|nr:4Fe-4S dicluster domain-containing protein [Bacteroidales bacterium OttesenSCG-928-I21]
MGQIIFIILLIVTIGVFAYSAFRIYKFFKLTKPSYRVKNIAKRIGRTIKEAFLQERIFRNPVVGFMHAMVFWGFCIILLGSIEIVIDGVSGQEKTFAFLGGFYNVLMALIDVFAYIIGLFIMLFILRRSMLNIRRLNGKELSHKNHQDAYMALSLIFILMITLIGMNVFYVAGHPTNYVGSYPISALIASLFTSLNPETIKLIHDINWWAHIILIFIFANILPYSKHFHIFMSIPSVFFSRLTPLGKMTNMESVTKEVKLMMNPETAFAAAPEGEEIARFGILDAEDITWKNYLDSLTCTQCGRCTSVCPANITGKELSPRKMIMNIRERMNEKAPHLIKEGNKYSDGKSLIRDYIKEEEIWACTTCNACARECPLDIDHPTFILDLRRYLVMEESAAPAQLNAIFSNIENNGAPWQYSNQDRLKWTE